MKSIFDFLQIAEKLKIEKRDNKLSNGEYESVASHSWMMGLFALLFHDKMANKINIGHALKIIIVHDLAEALVGDVGLYKQCSDNDKKCKADMEYASIKKMTSVLPPKKGQEIMSLWQEYEDKKTPEAKFAKACDKLEANAQAHMFKNIEYWSDYGPDFYYDDSINRRREHFWAHEPILMEFAEFLRNMTIERMEAEGIECKKIKTDSATFS